MRENFPQNRRARKKIVRFTGFFAKEPLGIGSAKDFLDLR
jgi:hypothetical protein